MMKKYKISFRTTYKLNDQFKRFMKILYEINDDINFVEDRRDDEELWKEYNDLLKYVVEAFLSDEEYEAIYGLGFITIEEIKIY